MEYCDILIIGAGAAGIAAAKAAFSAGCESIVLVDRKSRMGGVLLQCAHDGFGKNLTGPEYTNLLLEDFPETIRWYPNTAVISVSKQKTAVISGRDTGRKAIGFSQLILAAGCREIPMGALPIGGTRPRGIYTAGQMQEMMNLYGYIPQGPVVILGSGDLGLVMAKQIAHCGIGVTLVEQRDTCGGMARNRRCLEEYPISLRCGCTIREVCGEKYLEGVKTSDGGYIPCRTLLIAAGLRPERELIRGMEDAPWIHICGNCNRVHPMVEAVVHEGRQAGMDACRNLRGSL